MGDDIGEHGGDEGGRGEEGQAGSSGSMLSRSLESEGKLDVAP